ncbi:MAG: FtsW/RodA/SpoVE family cell cycle protein [Oscillospiraceae bacterium]|nr:FtsW/RodA/SpoVE family cell cycle protein [Oscillospiraceae bacterium]MDD7291960.1 FtsW/RodA/SpoVE family cell cycle protein [Clostridiaceae bacterium]MDY5990841.1 FtsW/RodA/SpoVE family cell cycle protein [Oscillospiraceae bacterium]
MKKASAALREDRRRKKYRYVDRGFILLLLTVFQFFSCLPVVFEGGKFYAVNAVCFLGFTLFEWLYVAVMHLAFKKVNFELEFIAFFLSGIGMTLTASVSKSSHIKQLAAVIIGVVVYDILLWFLQDVKRVMAVRMPLAVFALCFLAGSFLLIRFAGSAINGAYNWLVIGGKLSVQPSEFVKIAFIFVGAASLDKLLTSKNIYLYIAFAVGCIGVLFLMRDFGTALIFFFTFLVIAFMRSGDVRSLLFICAGALLGAVLIIYFKPYVAQRFAVYRHVWENYDTTGYQQVRTLIYSVSGGLKGLGVGNGRLRYVAASTTDLVFGMVCEEFGMIVAFAIVISFAIITVYAIRTSRSAPSTFYSIAACSAAAMLLFQTCLNIFGITDILPLTGVTLPFVSQGGSSMICSWALFAFIKAADVRTYPKVFKTA